MNAMIAATSTNAASTVGMTDRTLAMPAGCAPTECPATGPAPEQPERQQQPQRQTPQQSVSRRSGVIYRFCVLGGVAAGIVVATLFASRAGLAPLLWIATAAFAVAIALFLAAMTKVLIGKETFSFLHYQLAALLATSALLAAVRAPILPALDLLASALAVAQAIGRIGCATAGCCHGRPFRIGVRYDASRVAGHWSQARLFPVQWVESFALLVLAFFTASAVGVPGKAFVVYATSYAAVRFILELFRGDARRHFLGVSEAQWIGIVTVTAIAAWQGGFAIVVAATLAAVAGLLPFAHRIDFDAVARAIAAARTTEGVVATSGLRVSHGTIDGIEHYTLSAAQPLTPRRARALARVLRDVGHPDACVAIAPARHQGVYHVVVGGRP